MHRVLYIILMVTMMAMLKHMIDMGLSSEKRQKGIYFAESLEQITDILCSLKED